jgi:putative MATE family efflux protein
VQRRSEEPGEPVVIDAATPEAPRVSRLRQLAARDHTQGSLLASIAVLSLPSMLTSLFGGGLFQLVDLRFLGQLGSEAVAAAGATNQTLRQFFFLVVFGVSVSSQMMIARLVGAGSVDRAEHVAGQTLLLSIGLAGLIALLGGLFPERLVALVVRDAGTFELAVPYLRIAFVLMFSSILVQMVSSLLNGAGDATTPMLITFLVTPISILLEWSLAFGHLGFPALGIRGIALGAGTGGAVGALIGFWALSSGRVRVHLRRRHLVPDPVMLRSIATLSWQPALHMLARTTIVFFFMWLAGRLGGKVQAAYTIGLQLEMLAIMIAFPIANAAATLVGQNLGARNLERARRAIRVGFVAVLAPLWPLALLLLLFRHELVSVFTSDPEVASLAAEYLAFSAANLSVYGLYFVSFRSLQAAGDMNSPMIISVCVALFVGVPIGFVLATQSDLGATGMWIGNLAYGLLNTALMVTWLLSGRWARPHFV